MYKTPDGTHFSLWFPVSRKYEKKKYKKRIIYSLIILRNIKSSDIQSHGKSERELRVF